jgi:superfamily II DNA or RNA helicase
MIEDLKKILGGGGLHEDENKKLLDIIEQQKKNIKNLESKVSELVEEAVKRRPRQKRNLDVYDIVNLNRFFKTQEYKDYMTNPQIFQYDEGETAFEKNLKKNPNYFYKYQKNFIEDWSLSQQECTILYYGVGTGKTMIAVNCAEQYTNINDNSFVYFLVPASLVLVIISNMFKSGIDPTRKNNKGEYIYNFLSYQQCLGSKFDFKDNSLLIVDEIHNLRNFRTKGINEKISARKWEATDTYSLVGNKLAIALLNADNKFLRTIFMTGTLFVNTIYDIEPIIALGYKRAPLTNFEFDKIELINMFTDRMKQYYQGLISFYRKPSDTPNFPKTKYYFTPIYSSENDEDEDENEDEDETKSANGEDPYFIYSRNSFNYPKCKWILKFLKKHKNEKTLIYAQFLNKMVFKLVDILKKNKINYEIISGQLSAQEKQDVVKKYNDNKIKVLIFTLAIKEGISFKETNNFIFTQPYWNYAISEQVIARAIRSDSHLNGNKSIVNVYLLSGYDSTSKDNIKKINNFSILIDNIMNNDIKTYVPKILKTEKIIVKTKGEEYEKEINITELDELFKKTPFSRDSDLYTRMLNKQGLINAFEKKLLYEVDRFEKVNNIENNDFIQQFNAAIISLEDEKKRLLTNKEKLSLKKDLYKVFYENEIKKINSRITRFKNDSKFRTNRNPNLEENANLTKYKDMIPKIKDLLNKGKSLNDILKIFDISKQEITNFQANFTPENEVNILIEQSGIKNDTRNKIFILEPTAGIGNVLNGLLNCVNKQNFNIDAIEIHNLFYQIGFAQFSDIDNINYINMDFLKFQSKYNYDYIIGNPPFNLRTQIQTVEHEILKIKDVQLFDVNFVALSYNMLNNDGLLSMIISNRFMRDNNIFVFQIFNAYLNILKKNNPDNVKIINIENFKEDKTISKDMTTNFGMVCITLKKLESFTIDLNKPPRTDTDLLKTQKKIKAKERRDIKAKEKKDIKAKDKLKLIKEQLKNFD